MEDLSTIIWAVVIIGAMIFNSVAKARRARAKGEQAAPQHGEAWPSIPWEEEKAASDESETASQPARTASPVRNASSPAAEARSRETDAWSEDTKRHSETQAAGQEAKDPVAAGRIGSGHGFSGANIPEARTYEPEQPDFAAFPSKYESLEATVDEESQRTPNGLKTEISTPKERSRQHRKEISTTQNGAKTGAAEAKDPANLRKSAAEESAAEIAGEFDLRRAVIYSEILKPKFEE